MKAANADKPPERDEPAPLPQGWTEAFDTQSRKPYYYNQEKNQVTWERPDPNGPPPAQAHDNKEWKEAQDPKTRDMYDYNEKTMEAAWQVSDGAVPKRTKPGLFSFLTRTHTCIHVSLSTHLCKFRKRVNVSFPPPEPMPLGHGGDQANPQSAPIPPMDANAGGMALPMAPLPPGWAETIDAQSNRKYYYNSNTGNALLVKTKKAETKKEKKNAKPPQPALNATGETQWERPTAVGFSAAAPPPQPEFINAASFQGYRQGYVFKTGNQGLGYYLDAESGLESEPVAQMRAPVVANNSNPERQARRRPNRPNRAREDELDPMVSNTLNTCDHKQTPTTEHASLCLALRTPPPIRTLLGVGGALACATARLLTPLPQALCSNRGRCPALEQS